MIRIKNISQSICLLLLAIASFSCQQAPREMDIYLCIGQSNMAGRAPLTDEVCDTLDHVFLLNDDDQWIKAANPFNAYSTIRKGLDKQKLGPAYGFSKGLIETCPNVDLGLVVNAKGGSSINLWHPDSLFFKEAVRRTKIAMQYGELKGIIWHQGCSDANRTSTYMAKLEQMVTAFRKEFDHADLPLVVGQLSTDKPQRAEFNTMILQVPNVIPHSAVVSSEGLSTIDQTHFDTPSQLQLGKEYAAAMHTLLFE